MDEVLVVPLGDAKACKDALKEAGLLDTARVSARLDVHGVACVALPCVAGAAEAEMSPLLRAALASGAVWQRMELQPSGRAAASPHAALRSAVERLLRTHGAPTALLDDLPRRWERLGELLLLPASSFSAPGWSALPQPELWACVAAALSASRLARQAVVDAGPLRHSRATLLHPPGCADGWTTVRENGVVYCLDALCSMYSSGNGTEKARVARLPAAGETVVDLFAGIGYWTLPLLLHARARHVFACDLNPVSLRGLERALQLNALPPSACTLLQGDCGAVAPRRVATRVMLGLIPSAQVGYAAAVEALSDAGGCLHVHGNAGAGAQAAWAAGVAEQLQALARARRGGGWRARLLHLEVVKSYAPRILHCVADVQLTPPASPQAGPPGRPLQLLRLMQPDAEALRDAASRGAPAHISGLQLGGGWDAAALAACGDCGRAVAVHVCSEPSLNWHLKNFRLESMPLAKLAQRAASAPGGPWLYLRSVGSDARRQPACFQRDYPSLAEALSLPAWALPPPPRGAHSSVLRLASPGLRLWLHYDALDNVLLQLGGASKSVLLFPPSAAGGLYLQGSSSRIPTRLLDDPAAAAAAGFPRYEAAHAAALRLRLSPGEGLFIPANWAHFVACEAEGGPSVALNVFWAAAGEGPAAAERDVYGNADPPAATRALEAAGEAEAALLALPPSARGFFKARILAALEDVDDG